MIQYSVVTEIPDSEPVTLSEAKTHLEYVGSAKNQYITTLIKVARQICEVYAGLSFVTQERRVKLDRFPYNCKKYWIELPYGPVQYVTSFTYTKDDDSTVTLTVDEDFILDNHSRLARLFPINSDGEIDLWPTDYKLIPHAVTIDYQCGYDSVSYEPLPAQIKQAILLQVASMFENRQDEQQGGTQMINWNSKAILDTVKVEWNAHLD